MSNGEINNYLLHKNCENAITRPKVNMVFTYFISVKMASLALVHRCLSLTQSSLFAS